MIKRLAVTLMAALALYTSAPSTVYTPVIQPVMSVPRITFPTPTPTMEPMIYEVTAYTAGPESTGKRRGDPMYGITSSGEHVKNGYTLACPDWLSFGTVIYIDDVGVRVCADRGSRITAGHLDVYISNLHDARKFGRRRLRITILSMGSDDNE